MKGPGAAITFAFSLVAAVGLASCADTNREIRGLFASSGKRATTSPIPAPEGEIVRTQQSGQPAVGGATASPGRDGQAEAVFLPGTGAFINEEIAQRGATAPAGGRGVTFNFVDTELSEVVRSVLGNILKLNYTIDPRVKGKVTLQTNRPVPVGDVLSTLETVLRLHGASIIRSRGLYAVTPTESALRGDAVPRLNADGSRSSDAYGVQIIQLEYISADEMAGILEPFVRKGALVRIDDIRRVLLVSGTRNEREAASEIVKIFDVDWFSGMSFALFPLKFSSPEAVIADLAKVFDVDGKDRLKGIVRFQPIERKNAILAATSRPATLELAKSWIERLDIGNPTRDRRLYVYRVQNGRAADLAGVLRNIFGGSDSSMAKKPAGSLAPGLKPATLRSRYGTATGPQALGSADTVTQGLRQRALMRSTAGDTRESPPSGQRPSSSTAQTGPPRTAQGRAEELPDATALSAGPDIRIIADEINNSLVVLATPNEYRQIESALQKLDIVPLQVLIEATIAEVTLTDQLKYGVQWFFSRENTDVTLSTVSSGAVSSSFPGFSALFTSASDIRVVLNALDSVTDVNVISSPQLLVLDNRTAEIQVGDRVPIATQSAVSLVTPDAPVVNSIEFKDTGVVLRVTPRVNAGGLIILEIEQEVSDVIETTTSGIDSPTIQQRRIQTTVAVQSNTTIALGGLIKNRKTNTIDGVPILSQIPILGMLFGSTDDKIERTELLILIKPRIIRNQEDAREVTRELRKRVRVLTDEE